MLLENFYKIIHIKEREDGKQAIEIELNPGHMLYQGHFPGHRMWSSVRHWNSPYYFLCRHGYQRTKPPRLSEFSPPSSLHRLFICSMNQL